MEEEMRDKDDLKDLMGNEYKHVTNHFEKTYEEELDEFYDIESDDTDEPTNVTQISKEDLNE
jgi:hypothetical protein